MVWPETSYARRDDLHIGYQVWGDGVPDILDFGSGTFISIDEAAEQPQWRRYTERLAACGRLIRFDPSGVGMSDTPTDPSRLTMDAWAEDALAVMDHAGSARAVVLASTSSSLPALQFAGTHPDRTESVVLINATARISQDEDYDIGIPRELMERFSASLDPDLPLEDDGISDLRLFAPSRADDPDFQQWWGRVSRRGTAPATSAVLNQAINGADVRHLLGGITAPTLVIHRQDAIAFRVSHGEYVAARIPGARFVVLPGADMIPFCGDADRLVDEVHEFITGERYQPALDRVFATVLFTDIVDSTATATRMGDRRWTQVLRDHDALVRRQLERFGGTFVKDTGDGLLATFDGPSRAIRCALAIRDGAGHLGVQIRAGLHAGEVERRGDDVGGIAVHVAARVAGMAAAGEVLVSHTVVDLVEGAGIAFVDRGTHALKGVGEPRHVWAVAGA